MPQQNATDSDNDDGLNPSEEKALSALVVGETVTAAAEVASVSRSTVHRWLNEPRFEAAYNRRRRDLQEAAVQTLHRLQEKALDVVGTELDAGNPRVALAVLRGTGLLDGKRQQIGSDDPHRLAREQAEEQRHDQLMYMLSGAGEPL